MTIKEIPVAALKPYENNPRINENAVAAVAASIQNFGFKVPIVIDCDNVIVAGHTRLKAAQQLGLQFVPCIVADDLTPEQIKAFRVADNKTAELADWDFDKLESELLQLAELDFDMTQFGFDELEDEEMEIVEDEAPDVDESAQPVSQLGDVWQLGKHRLICGDSTDQANIERLMNGKKAKLLLTDPPYGINVVQNRKVGGGGALHFNGKKGKHVDSSNYIPIANDENTDAAKESYAIAKDLTENQIIFGGNYFTDFLPPSRCWIVWDKQNTGNFADAELAWTSFNKGVKLYKFLWNGLAREGKRDVEGKSRVHPTQKPVGLMAYILEDFTNEADVVLDLFGGSGSTLIACEQLNRVCYMCELDPHYCDVIIKRWEDFTGERAKKIESS